MRGGLKTVLKGVLSPLLRRVWGRLSFFLFPLSFNIGN
jgi:hypothetical protein